MKPGVPDGTMIAEISFEPSGFTPVTAVTVTSAVMSVPLLVMKAFDPLMTHSSVDSSSTARVAVPPASEPKPGSVSPNAAMRLAADELRQPRRLLLVGAEPVDRHRAERDRGLERDRHAGVDPGQLLQGEAEREVVAAHAADRLRERQPEQAHLAHLPDDVVREGVIFVVLADHRRHDVVGEGAHARAQGFVLLVEREVRHDVS